MAPDPQPARARLDGRHVARQESTALPTTQDPPDPIVDRERDAQSLVGTPVWITQEAVVIPSRWHGVVKPSIAPTERVVVLDPVLPCFDRQAFVADHFAGPT